jgi:hypothetical protein
MWQASLTAEQLAHNPLQSQHNPHWTCNCLLWHYRKPASQPASQQAVTSCSTACPVLCCSVCSCSPFHIFTPQSNFSSPDTRPSHGPMSSVAEVGLCLCDTYQMAMSACLCNEMHPTCEVFTACFHFRCSTTVQSFVASEHVRCCEICFSY